jgi:hypothetical protein
MNIDLPFCVIKWTRLKGTPIELYGVLPQKLREYLVFKGKIVLSERNNS